jgi:hypothetical protein
MTRKQALQRALDILYEWGNAEEAREIQTKLTEIISDLPFTAWTKETIVDAFDQFAIDNGRNATTTDIKKRGLPPHTVIKLKFGMDAKRFLSTYYPQKCDSRIYAAKTKEEWLEFFKKEYERLKPGSAEKYNSERRPGSPSWQTIARFFNISKWKEFQEFCGVSVHYKIGISRRDAANITVHSDLADAYEPGQTEPLELEALHAFLTQKYGAFLSKSAF